MSPLSVGILGCGGIGARHAAAIAALPGEGHLTACIGRDAERTAAFAARHGGRAWTSLEALLAEAPPDLLIVALPPFAHAGQVEAAARAGVNLLVEKPIAPDAGRAAAMVAAGDAAGVTAACGFMYRFGDAVRRWDALAAAGATGPAGHFTGAFHCNALHAPWWRQRAGGGGQMVEQLIHIVDLARHWLGMPHTVYARAANLFHRDVAGYDSEDASAIILGYEGGEIAVLGASNAAVQGQWRKGWQVVARDMTGVFDDWNAATLYPATGAAPETMRGATDVFVEQIRDVVAAIREGRAPRVPLSDGLDSLRIVLAARRSADEGREVRL